MNIYEDILIDVIDKFIELDLPDELLPTVVAARTRLLTDATSDDVEQQDILTF